MGRKLGAPFPFGEGGAGSPSNTMLLGLRPTSLPNGILIHPAIWPQQIWAENWGLRPLLGEGMLGPGLTQCGHCRGILAWQVSSWSIRPFGCSTPTSGGRTDGRSYLYSAYKSKESLGAKVEQLCDELCKNDWTEQDGIWTQVGARKERKGKERKSIYIVPFCT